MKNYPNKNILIIADTQMPYERKDYLKFCKKMQKKHKCGRVIHIGDIADCLNFSSYERDPSCPSIPDEIESLRKSFKIWAKTFPNVELCRIYASSASSYRILNNPFLHMASEYPL